MSWLIPTTADYMSAIMPGAIQYVRVRESIVASRKPLTPKDSSDPRTFDEWVASNTNETFAEWLAR